MDTDNSKPSSPKPTGAKPKETTKPAVTTKVKVPPMFRKMDWLAMLITFGTVWAVYLFTLAPNVTLEDSGELCTGSFYAGIPHPPGYPFWAIWSYIWTVIVPFGSVAWRVEVGQSFASALGCGLLALMVSRGGSMLIEGIEELKEVNRRWESAICIVSGAVAGMLLGFGFFMWKESVVINRISIFGVPWLLAMIALLMRWMYAPEQRWYLYIAMLFYGWIATIHQSLILGALGVEILIALVLPRLGRDLFAINSLMYLIILFYIKKGTVPALNAMTFTEQVIFNTVGIFSLAGLAWLFTKTGKIFTEWKSVLIMGGMWLIGVLVYLYEPVSCMTVPPMQWGYPRTVEGFFHALSRGQYGTGEGTNVLQDPARFVFQLYYLAQGLSESFSWVYMFIGLLPFLFLKKMHQRERNWIIGLTALYLLLSVQLVMVLNVTPDRSTSELNKVFFTASHGVFAILIGYGLTLLAAYIATHYQKFRRTGLIGGGVALLLALYCMIEAVGKLYFGKAGQLKIGGIFYSIIDHIPFPHIFSTPIPDTNKVEMHFEWQRLSNWGGWEYLGLGPNGQFGLTDLPHWIAQSFAPHQFGWPVYANLLLMAMAVVFLIALVLYRKRGPVLVILALFCVAPVWSVMSHWYKCEQRNHWFGYWFGHDMFTPPFKDPSTGQLTYDNELRAKLLQDPKNTKLFYPEMARDTIVFGGTDPGRFCPTYMIFCESFIPPRCQPKQDQAFNRRDCYLITQNALADGTYLDYLRSQYNRSQQQDPPFFSRLFKYVCAVGGLASRDAIVLNGIDTGNGDSGNALIEGVASILETVLDKPFLAWGRHVEARRRAEGVYPRNEIYIPSPDDSTRCFEEYTQDVGRRAQLHQLKPGEDVRIENGRVQVSGQVAVMNINGLLCKVIFDHNPTNEFYIEESFPLDWMYPYETPFGVIMKINRQPLTELSQDVFDLDHKFWTDFSSRLCGNFIDYDTSISNICAFVERTYIGNNFTGYTGSRAFARDESGQKAFSKLRSSQAGMYAWRCGFPNTSPQCPPEYRQKSEASQAALVRETDFAFKQAYAFCPYSPEALYRYVNFLLPQGRFDDAIQLAETSQKLDPFNTAISDLIDNLKSYKAQNEERMKAIGQVGQMEQTARANPGDVRNLVSLGVTYAQLGETNRAVALLDQALASPNAKAADIATIASYYSQIGNLAKLEGALGKLADLSPDQPEPRYDLAALQAYLGHTSPAVTNLKIALDLSAARLKTNPAARDMLAEARKDPHLNPLRASPEFQALTAPK
jgi:tetratricopeptide (TPR) repeat protein